MKVNPTIGNVTYLERSRRNGDATDKEQGNAGYHAPDKRESESENREPSYNEVARAANEIAEDPALQALGFETEVEANGPGLRVTLRGGKTGIVRQFTGQEFLEMREAAQATGRGKILDRKA